MEPKSTYLAPLLFLGGAIALLSTVLRSAGSDAIGLRKNAVESSPELDYSRKKRIYVKRQQAAHKQMHILKGTKEIPKYHKKKASGKKTEQKEIKYKIGDKVFSQKIKLPIERAHGLN